MKKCSRCQQEKELTEYYKNKARADGLANYCKKCHSTHNRGSGAYVSVKSEQYDDNYKKNMSEIIKEKYKDTEYRKKVGKASSKSIQAFNDDNELIHEYPSALAAKEDGFNNARISNAISKGVKYKNLNWRFK